MKLNVLFYISHVGNAGGLPAGRSSRMNEWKPLLRFGEATLIETVVTTALEVCRRVVLVVGYRGEDLAKVFKSEARVIVVKNQEWESGMFSSIQTGVNRIDTDRFFIVPGDMPYLTAEVYRALCDAPRADVIAPIFNGRRGHPVLLNGALIGKIANAGSEIESMREILAKENLEVIQWMDDSILRDIDTPEDYREGHTGQRSAR